MYHSRQFCTPIMSPFFHPYEPYDDINLDDVHPAFHPPMYPIDGESDYDTRLILTYSMESNPSKPSYPFVIFLMSNSFSFTASWAPRPHRGRRFILT